MNLLKQYYKPNYWLSWLQLALMWLSVQLPYSMQLKIGAAIGWLFYHCADDRRHITEVNIELCFPELTAAQRAQLVRDTFFANGIGIIETAIAWFGNVEKYRHRVEVQGLNYVQTALEQGRGILLVGLHHTTLDIAGALLALFIKVDAIYRHSKDPLIDAVMHRSRSRFCEKVIAREDIREVVRRLKQNKVIWYAPDQDYGPKHSVFVPFFGVPAATITATSRFANFNRSPVIMFSHYRKPDNQGYALYLSPPLENFPSGDEIKDAAEINQKIEAAIRQQPEQYMWLHKRFKTQAEGKAARPYKKLQRGRLKRVKTTWYEAIVQNSQVISQDDHGIKVLQHSDGRIIKLFRVKRWYSFAYFYSYAARFAKNVQQLQAKAIATVQVLAAYSIPSIKRTAVVYQPLSGVTLRAHFEQRLAKADIELLASFIAELHQKGIYFRSLHLGNIVLTSPGVLGLIDVSDMTVKSKLLSWSRCQRNFEHLFRYTGDIKFIASYAQAFIESYSSNSTLPAKDIQRLKTYLYRRLKI